MWVVVPEGYKYIMVGRHDNKQQTFAPVRLRAFSSSIMNTSRESELEGE